MVAWVVNFRTDLRRRSRSLNLLPLSHYILSFLLPHLLFPSSHDEKSVTASPLESAFTNCDARNLFRMCSYANCRVSLALSSRFSLFAPRVIHKSCAFKRLRTLSKYSRVYPNSAHSGTRFLTNHEIGFRAPHPIKSPHCLRPAGKWTGQMRTHHE